MNKAVLLNRDGVISEDAIRELNHEIEEMLMNRGALLLDAFYFCPHHPNPTLPEYCMRDTVLSANYGMRLGDLPRQITAPILDVERKPTHELTFLNLSCRSVRENTENHRSILNPNFAKRVNFCLRYPKRLFAGRQENGGDRF